MITRKIALQTFALALGLIGSAVAIADEPLINANLRACPSDGTILGE